MTDRLERKLAIAANQDKADLLIKNGQIVDVFQLETFEGDVVIADGEIVAISDPGTYEAHEEVDAKGAFIAPAFIDGHVHIESSMVAPEQFAKVVVPHGVTTVIADPHEIANVAGVQGVEYMLDASEGIPLDVKMMVPSCVPATPFEHSGARLTAEEVAELFRDPRIFGLGEVMDYPAVLTRDQEMMAKLKAAHSEGRIVDGHGAGLDSVALNAYTAAGIGNDHEAVTPEEAKARLQRGMYLLIREGTAAKDFDALMKAITPMNSRRALFVTDDKHLDELVEEGSIDHHVRKAIQIGVNPLQAIQMASLNAAECFKLAKKGAIAPGFTADLLFIEDLQSLAITHVFKNGTCVAKNGKLIVPIRETVQPPQRLLESVNMKLVTKEQLELSLQSDEEAHLIQIQPGSIVTKHIREKVAVKDGVFIPSVARDQLKLVVAERHHKRGTVGVGIVKGFGLTKGAIATTVAHDSHNIVAVGTNDEDLLTAIKELENIQGGMTIVKDGKVLVSLPLTIGGLMSDQSYDVVCEQIKSVDAAIGALGFVGDFNPFLTLSFLALPVIPEIKLTDQGLFDVTSFSFIDQQVYAEETN
ncbi:adenine deaminase [Halalkalibacterium halodurans]|uniref:adenine deaminase n=1 Tax=Halalkalibacterium halodurans TaxID=86665 RepID=UPI002AAA58CE|nr:adenine deaminase [Halalkalibacterium halodurans]MDY7221133.1 adenine deaminase [Halalkalibacterium halodurans]MDY7240372.1 adenine deaminase [Halalkalibacterium halodurans]